MPILLGLVAIVLLGALVRPPHRHVVPRLLLIAVALSATGCDGCSPTGTPGPLRPDENTRFHISDRLGSSALVLNHEGEVIARNAHEPFGDRWVAWRRGDSPASTYAFTGKERDPLAGSVAIGARDYLPALGRWASADPLFLHRPEASLEHPRERNLYRYAGNNPIAHVDPNGTSAWTKLAKVGAKLAKGASAVEAFAGNIQDARTLVDPDAGIGDRLLAGVSLASEVLPVSIGDVRDVASWTQRALKAAPDRKALAAASSATRTAKHAANIKWKGFSKGSEARHYTKHGSEFGDITQAEYRKQAKAFAADAASYQEQVVGNFVVKYDPGSRRTLIGHAKSREIRTFYKADNRDADPFAAAVKLAENLGQQ